MKNGLAYSSRNKLLNQKSIKGSALLISKLKKLFILLRKNLNNNFVINFLKENKEFNIEYLELRNKNNLSKKISKKNVKIFIAFYVKGVRLIDNF